MSIYCLIVVLFDFLPIFLCCSPVVQYPDKESAVQAVEDGNAWGVIHFEENFSENLYKVRYMLALGH